MSGESDFSQLKTKVARLEANAEAHNSAMALFANELRELNKRLISYMESTVNLERSTRDRFEGIDELVAEREKAELQQEAAELKAKIVKLEARPESLIKWVAMLLGLVGAFYSAVRAYRAAQDVSPPHQGTEIRRSQ